MEESQKKKHHVGSLLYAIAPAIYYSVLSNVVYLMLGAIYRLVCGGELSGLVLQALSVGVCLVVFGAMAAKSGALARRGEPGSAGRNVFRYPAYFCCVVSAVMTGIGASNLIYMTGLQQRSVGYQHVTEHFFGHGLWLELLALVILSPLAEEIVVRGLVYRRLCAVCSAPMAVLGSAAVFGVMHFNLVQGIYALVMGILFAYIVYRTDSFAAAVAAHMAVNLVSVLQRELGLLDFMEQSRESFYVATAVSLCLGGVFISYARRLLDR